MYKTQQLTIHTYCRV